MTDPSSDSFVSAEQIAEFALSLIREPSQSPNEARVAALVQQEMERLGFAVDVDRLGNVTGTIGEADGPCVLIDAHMDTVGVTQPEAWLHEPYGEIDGAQLCGRGSMDMKGPLAAAIYGVAALNGRKLPGRVVVSASIAEELVEGTALELVAQRVKPNFVIIGEATSLNIARGQRGRAEILVEVHGRPTHSSQPEHGVNAALAMVDVVGALRKLEPPSHPVLGAGILVLTDIMSHPYPGLSVVPDRCVATFDRRTLPGETAESVLAPIRATVERALAGSDASATVSIAIDDFASYTGERLSAPNFAPAWFFDEQEPIVALARRGLAQAGIEPTLSHYAFCTNGSGTAGRLGIPTIGFGPGNEDLAHRVNEYVEIAELGRAARGYASIAAVLLEER